MMGLLLLSPSLYNFGCQPLDGLRLDKVHYLLGASQRTLFWGDCPGHSIVLTGLAHGPSGESTSNYFEICLFFVFRAYFEGDPGAPGAV